MDSEHVNLIIIKRTDGKRPDGVTLLPWKNGRCATWDVTVTDTMAQSYLHNTSRTAGAAAEAAADKKKKKEEKFISSKQVQYRHTICIQTPKL